jgi:hypothetical protein
MSITTVGHAADEHATSVPSFLSRGPMHKDHARLATLGALDWPSVSALLLLLVGGVSAAGAAAALSAFVLAADQPPKRGVTPAELPVASVQHEAGVAPAAEKNLDDARAPTDTPKQQMLDAKVQAGAHDTRLVRTEIVHGDPTVWAGVHEFVPLSPDQVPIVAPGAQPPTAASAALDSPKRIGARHGLPAGAKRHQKAQRYTRGVRHAQTPAGSEPPSDVGGTQMSRADLKRDGSKNPVVSAFSAILGPN